MHTCDLNVSINKLSKIEGHADLDIVIKDGKVVDVNLRVMENMRFFEEAVKGQSALVVPSLVSRICGTCSIAHMTACTEAVEKTLGIAITPQTMTLRKLTMYSLMIRDHALHLYFFVLPDLYGVDSALDLPEEHKELIHEALHVKEAGNNLSTLVAGRSVHATYEMVGGFNHVPAAEDVPAVIEELKSIRPMVLNLCEIFYKCDWELKRKTNFVALATSDFSFLEGEIHTSSGEVIPENKYWDHLHEVVLPYSQANGFEFEGKEYMVGALSRLNLNREAMHADTKRDAAKYLAVFPSDNIYLNNLAQAIEILHSIDHAIELLEENTFTKEEIVKPTRLTGEGVGVIEAPRGTLYYWLGIDEGKVRYVNLVIPTAQNLVNMREDVRQAVGDMCSRDDVTPQALEEKIRKEVEKIIRAYDPCMSCASHFLQINWK
ncbi:MAG: nickel-dependent hydrogenase large subunit [Candidatus Falkowbacteria bacterium]